MSNPWAVVGLTYDSVDLQVADFQFYFWIQTGLNELPSTRGVDVVVPGQAGRSRKNRINDVLQIVLMGQVTADPASLDEGRDSFRENMLTLRDLFASDRVPAEMVATLENGTVARITARPLNIVPTDQIPGVFWLGSVELEGYDDWIVSGS